MKTIKVIYENIPFSRCDSFDGTKKNLFLFDVMLF